MVLSIGSTPLIRMPFRAAPIHIRPSSLKHFISSPFVASNSVCRRRCSVLTRTQRQASMGQHVESSVLSLVKLQTLCDPRGDPRGAQTQPNFAMSRQSFWVHVQVDQMACCPQQQQQQCVVSVSVPVVGFVTERRKSPLSR